MMLCCKGTTKLAIRHRFYARKINIIALGVLVNSFVLNEDEEFW